jgi:hypothetical protein
MSVRLRGQILSLLGNSKKGLTEEEIVKKLIDKGADFHAEVEFRRRVVGSLLALKHQHRAWPVGHRWTITDRGKRSHG